MDAVMAETEEAGGSFRQLRKAHDRLDKRVRELSQKELKLAARVQEYEERERREQRARVAFHMSRKIPLPPAGERWLLTYARTRTGDLAKAHEAAFVFSYTPDPDKSLGALDQLLDETFAGMDDGAALSELVEFFRKQRNEGNGEVATTGG